MSDLRGVNIRSQPASHRFGASVERSAEWLNKLDNLSAGRPLTRITGPNMNRPLRLADEDSSRTRAWFPGENPPSVNPLCRQAP